MHYTQRMVEPESVFGQINNNRGLDAYCFVGLPNVSLEVGWLSFAHNLLKKAVMDRNREMAAQGAP
ncbi:transposase [Paenibacillus sp. Sa2BVA9]|uniref:Transposase n=1 Tax=Paenibacillus gallinarum TaxID=2762232 RepID=A0ABR8T2U1_9BACL|nr:transposase [Paenibacillus gallinarum]